MPSAADLTPDSRFLALFVGPSGSGKKGAAASWVKTGPILYFDFDLRIRGLLGSPWVDRTDITYNSYPPKGDKTVFERLNNDLESLYNSIEKRQCKYKTLIFGSVTGTAKGFLTDSLGITQPGGGGRERSISRNLGPLKIAGIENFRFVNDSVMQVISFLQSVPINVIVLGHTMPIWEQEDGEEDNPFAKKKIVGHELNLSPKLSSQVPGVFDHIWEFRKIATGAGNALKVKFNVEFRGQMARTTFVKLPNGFQDITETNLYDKVQGYLAK